MALVELSDYQVRLIGMKTILAGAIACIVSSSVGCAAWYAYYSMSWAYSCGYACTISTPTEPGRCIRLEYRKNRVTGTVQQRKGDNWVQVNQ